jgi:AraC family transcriptional regulator
MSSDSASTADRHRLTSLARYQEQVPGRMVLAHEGDLNEDLQLRSHRLPAKLDEAAPAPAIPHHTLTFVYAGAVRGERRVADGAWEAFDTTAAGHVTIRPSGASTALRWTADRPIQTTSLYLAPRRLEAVGMQMGMAPSRVELRDRFNVADAVLRALVQPLRRLAAADENGDPLYLQTALQAMAVRLLRQHGSTPPDGPAEAGRLSRSRLHRVQRYVHAHLDADLSLDDLAREVGLSKYHFSRRFKERTGQSPYQFVIYERVRAARHLLRNSNRPLAQIALDVGFNSQSHFTRTFKRHVGATPGRYRAAWQE